MTWLLGTPVAFVVGKGGVGSSTIAGAWALAAARQGADVLFIGVDGRPGMGPLLGGKELDATDRVLQKVTGGGRIRGRTIPPEDAFGDYLELRGVGGLLRRAASAASLPMIAAATPGLEHLLVLGKIKELARDGAADLIIVDAPPAGHAAPFLRSASGLSEVVTSGPVRDQADEVREMLVDPERCAAMIVTLPEETPVSEALELAADLGPDGLGISLTPTVLNACWPEHAGLDLTVAAAAKESGMRLAAGTRDALGAVNGFVRARIDRQREQLARLEAGIGGSVIVTPRLADTRISPDMLGVLADALVDAADIDEPVRRRKTR